MTFNPECLIQNLEHALPIIYSLLYFILNAFYVLKYVYLVTR